MLRAGLISIVFLVLGGLLPSCGHGGYYEAGVGIYDPYYDPYYDPFYDPLYDPYCGCYYKQLEDTQAGVTPPSTEAW
jgi:hypothetical protein